MGKSAINHVEGGPTVLDFGSSTRADKEVKLQLALKVLLLNVIGLSSIKSRCACGELITEQGRKRNGEASNENGRGKRRRREERNCWGQPPAGLAFFLNPITTYESSRKHLGVSDTL